MAEYGKGNNRVSIPRRELEKLSGALTISSAKPAACFHSPEGIREAVCQFVALLSDWEAVVSIPRRELEKLSDVEHDTPPFSHGKFPFPGGN